LSRFSLSLSLSLHFQFIVCYSLITFKACLGGFVLPFLGKLGLLKKKWDFSVRGVTSISVDVHKYGFGPKGASMILYRNEDYR
jgi:sphinganine-1-phosphate aldolase